MAYQRVLTHQGWLSKQPDDFQQAVFAAGRRMRVSRGQTVYSMGDPPGGAFGVVSGQMALDIASGHHGPQSVHIAMPGWWFGTIPFLSRGPRHITFRAVEDCELFSIPLVEMDRLSENSAETVQRFAQITVLNLELALRGLAVLLESDPRRRIAAKLLLCLSDPTQNFLTISQSELGLMCNASRNTVGRTLGSFAESGWIRLHYAKIELVDRKSLEHLVAND